MTTKKTEPGDSEFIPGLGTKTFRTALLVLVVSMHPLGRQILGTVGFRFPDEQKLVVATEKASDANQDVKLLKEDVRDLKESVTRQNATALILNSKMDDVSKTLTAFKIDLEEFRKHVNITATAKPQ